MNSSVKTNIVSLSIFLLCHPLLRLFFKIVVTLVMLLSGGGVEQFIKRNLNEDICVQLVSAVSTTTLFQTAILCHFLAAVWNILHRYNPC